MPGRSARLIRSRRKRRRGRRASARQFRVVADLLKAAAEQFQFTPQRPASEVEFKRAYARYAQAAGLTREQAVRVYSFETGGTGNHDMQSGYRGPGKRAISTAIGYNQLLTTNSVELMAEQGHEFVKALTAKAATLSGPARKSTGPQDRGAEEDGGVHAHRCRTTGRRMKSSRTRRRAGRSMPWCWTSTSGRCCRPTSS